MSVYVHDLICTPHDLTFKLEIKVILLDVFLNHWIFRYLEIVINVVIAFLFLLVEVKSSNKQKPSAASKARRTPVGKPKNQNTAAVSKSSSSKTPATKTPGEYCCSFRKWSS